MCGISGIITANPALVTTSTLECMNTALAHRGPDGEGVWICPTGHAGFAHRRLAIIDTSAAAAQPMHYNGLAATAGRYTIVHNGEIYNYTELRDSLRSKGYTFTTASDTEVILAAYDCYGEDCLQHFDGMFAFAIWDAHTGTLFAARDRFGEKPFYYHFHSNCLWFASEMKALWAAGIEKTTDAEMLLRYITLGHNQSPIDPDRTFYRSIFSLPPACFISYAPGRGQPELVRYYDFDKQAVNPLPEKDAIERFNNLLRQSVQKRLRSDVPLGTSLSGGLDSSAIAALCGAMAAPQYTHQCFTASFTGYEKDELPYAQQVATALQLQQHIVNPAAEELVQDFERLCYHHEQPVLSASVYAQYRVYKAARQHGVPVLLDGQGADEILGGYHKYIHWFLQELLRSNRPQMRHELKALRRNHIPFRWGWRNYLSAFMPAQTAQRLENKEVSATRFGSLVHPEFAYAHFNRLGIFKPIVNRLNDILYFNTRQMGLEELLRYADRNSMAHAVEVRLPFLQHELVEFIFSLPAAMKIHDGFTKWILRKAADPLLPPAINWRTDKIGYEPPQQQWLQQPAMQEKLAAAKAKLTGLQVLNKKLPATDAATDWRIVCAAELM